MRQSGCLTVWLGNSPESHEPFPDFAPATDVGFRPSLLFWAYPASVAENTCQASSDFAVRLRTM